MQITYKYFNLLLSFSFCLFANIHMGGFCIISTKKTPTHKQNEMEPDWRGKEADTEQIDGRLAIPSYGAT